MIIFRCCRTTAPKKITKQKLPQPIIKLNITDNGANGHAVPSCEEGTSTVRSILKPRMLSVDLIMRSQTR